MRLLLAPAGHGKTAYVIEQIRALRATGSLAPCWVIVPNQEQAGAFRRRLARAGGAIGVEIDTFYGVYAHILELSGESAPRLSEPVQHRLLRAAIDTLCEEGMLEFYAPLRDKPGFLQRLRELILELKQALIEPAAFAEAVSGETQRTVELAAIYGRYQNWLQQSGWADAEGQGWLAEVALKKHQNLGKDIHYLAVDGFDEFNPTQLAVLRLLAGRARLTLVTLTGDLADPPRDAHRRFTRARDDLCTACEDIETLAIPAAHSERPPAFTALESALFTPNPQAPIPNPQSSLSLLEARNRSEETRAALRWLKSLIVRDGIAPQDTAILARNIEVYRPFLLETADEFGMSLHISGGDELALNPAIAALLDLLALPVRDWPQQAVLDAWRNPYFNWSPLLQIADEAFSSMEQAANRLAEAVRGSRIIAGLPQWRTALAQRAEITEMARVGDEDERDSIEGPVGAEAAALLAMFEAFVHILNFGAPLLLSEHIAAVEDLIGGEAEVRGQRSEDRGQGNPQSLNIVVQAAANPITKERDLAALRAFKEALRGLLVAEHLAAQAPSGPEPEPMPYRRFYSELQGAVAAASYRLPRPTQGAITAASVLQARGVSFEAVALLGLSEGEFPQQEREDPLLTDQDRTTLRDKKVELQPRILGDEITLFYEAVTRARQHLLLTRPYLTDDGQSWEASPYWQEVQRVTGVAPERVDVHATPASVPEYLAALAQPPDSLPADLDDDWAQVQHAAAILSARQAKRAAGPYEGDAAAIFPRLLVHYPSDHVWSASRLESYAACAFMFFVGSGLALEQRQQPEEGFDVLILGSIFHAVLEEVYRQARDQNDWSGAALQALLPQVTGPIFDAAPRRYGFRPTPWWDYQRAELEGVLARTLAGLSEMVGDFEPHALEAAFGIGGAPPLRITTNDGFLHLRGFIDRVDRNPADEVRIIDYKSGSTPITPNDLTEGKRLQLPLYALVAAEALGFGEVVSGLYWHIGTAEASRLTLERYPGGLDAALDIAVAYAIRATQGIRAGRFQPEPPAKGCPAFCPAKEFCWRYKPGN
ncbi:MAG: exodeoxyribonuclease V subunit gamma [Caldilineales bacterium]|nr:exodeoxyribonuclease V subunit gamma [Caldilineales bacterium]